MSISRKIRADGGLEPEPEDIHAIAAIIKSLDNLPGDISTRVLVDGGLLRVVKAYCDRFVGVAEEESVPKHVAQNRARGIAYGITQD